eukprot:TRINITY_DN21620_c0_g1_i1.p1 TRINITY_DN21620_c0_g1~~TRINITY_DN21620_c0_g1_i1.p1  ORF type:complete len:374 (+),score=55.69 TRINITY_DN21620_c0_g1_i1:90-1211(+)
MHRGAGSKQPLDTSNVPKVDSMSGAKMVGTSKIADSSGEAAPIGLPSFGDLSDTGSNFSGDIEIVPFSKNRKRVAAKSAGRNKDKSSGSSTVDTSDSQTEPETKPTGKVERAKKLATRESRSRVGSDGSDTKLKVSSAAQPTPISKRPASVDHSCTITKKPSSEQPTTGEAKKRGRPRAPIVDVVEKDGANRRGRKAAAKTTTKPVILKRPAAVPAEPDVGAEKKLLAKRRKSNIAWQMLYKRRGWAKRLVWFGKKKRTAGGLTKKNLMKNRNGRVVSKLQHRIGKIRYVENGLNVWCSSMLSAREKLGVKGFVKVKRRGNRQEAALFQSTIDEYTQSLMARLQAQRQKAGLPPIQPVGNDTVASEGAASSGL